MKFTYHPDLDSLTIRLTDDVCVAAANITHLAQALLAEDNRIKAISIAMASRQFRNTDLATMPPRVTWRVPALGINVPLSDGARNGTGPADKLEVAYFPDGDTLLLNFADGPSDIVVDITNCDIADVLVDGTLSGITLSWAQELLQIEDPQTEVPEFQWKVYDPEPTPDPAKSQRTLSTHKLPIPA